MFDLIGYAEADVHRARVRARVRACGGLRRLEGFRLLENLYHYVSLFSLTACVLRLRTMGLQALA